MLEGAWAKLLGSWGIAHLHLVELASHHLLSLHIGKLLFHHGHLASVLHLSRVLVALCSLSGTSVTHDHAFHHVS